MAAARKLLAQNEGGPPSQAEMRRAISTAYNALFHFVSHICVEELFQGCGKDLTRAREQAYRSLDHRDIASACERARAQEFGFPESLRDFATVFCKMQKSRHLADYDPSARGNVNIRETHYKIDECELAIQKFNLADPDHQRAFAILTAIKTRSR